MQFGKAASLVVLRGLEDWIVDKSGLFESAGGRFVLPACNIQDFNLLKHVGSWMAWMVIEGYSLQRLRLNPNFFRFLVDEPASEDDLETFDPNTAVQLLSLMANPVSQSPFAKEGWLDVDGATLSEDNKGSFFEQKTFYILLESRKDQLYAIRKGLQPLLDMLERPSSFELMSLFYDGHPVLACQVYERIQWRNVLGQNSSVDALKSWIDSASEDNLKRLMHAVTGECFVDWTEKQVVPIQVYVGQDEEIEAMLLCRRLDIPSNVQRENIKQGLSLLFELTTGGLLPL